MQGVSAAGGSSSHTGKARAVRHGISGVTFQIKSMRETESCKMEDAKVGVKKRKGKRRRKL